MSAKRVLFVGGSIGLGHVARDLRQSATSPTRLAEVILANMGAPVQWPQIPVNGARAAAEAIHELL